MTEWQDVSDNLYVPKAQYEAMKRRLTASNADLLEALKLARRWLTLQLINDHEDMVKIDRAITKAEGRP